MAITFGALVAVSVRGPGGVYLNFVDEGKARESRHRPGCQGVAPLG